jgi:hypothetical protein
MGGGIAQRLQTLDWPAITRGLDDHGYAATTSVLTPRECAELAALYADDTRFRSRIEMTRYGFGSGEYKYFLRPLPRIVEELRHGLYSCLAPVANHWTEQLGGGPSFPTSLTEFLDVCARHGQTKPTPLVLYYTAGDYNCLHQDLYGDIAFPLQVTFALSRRGMDYEGGEFLLVEQRPRAQSRGQVVNLDLGEAVIFATRYRPVRGSRGYYRANMRHGVSRLTAGRRYTLGIIFHDAT